MSNHQERTTNQKLTDRISELAGTSTRMIDTLKTQEEYEEHARKLEPFPKASSLICRLDKDWMRFFFRWLKFGTPVEDVVAIIEVCDTAGVHPKVAFGFTDELSRIELITEMSANFRLSRAEFSKWRKDANKRIPYFSGHDRKTNLDKNFLTAARIIYSEEILMRVMEKWRSYREPYTLLTFLRYLERYEELKDFPIDWAAKVLPEYGS